MSPRSSVRVLLSVVIALLVPTTFLAPAAQAAGVSASASVVESTPTRLAIQVEGSGYSEEQPGIYVGLSESGGASAVDASVYRGTKYLKPTDLPGGAFDVTLELDADDIASLDPAKSYSVYTLKAHGQAAADPSQNAEAPVSIDFSTLTPPDEEDGDETGSGGGDGGSNDGDDDGSNDGGPEGGDTETVTPSVEVSSTQFSADGSATVTVTGSGFEPSASVAVQPPFAGQSGGAYVVFGKFAQDWRPSEGAGSSTRVNTSQKWAVPASQAPMLGSSGVVLSADGSFTAELTVDKSAIDAAVVGKANAADLVNYGIYTYAGGGAKVPSFETYTPVTFTVTPSVEVSSTQFSADGSATVTVTGSGFEPSASVAVQPPFAGQSGGAYVVFGKFAQDWRPSEGAGSSTRVNTSQKWAVPASQAPMLGSSGVVLSADGSFTAELTVDKSAIDAAVAGKANAADLVNYGIYTYAGGGAKVPSFETYTPVTFSEPEPVGASLEVEVTEQVEGSLKLSAVGTGYAKQFPGVYVTLAPSGGADAQDAGAHVKAVYVSHNDMNALGGFTTELALGADDISTLDPAVDYSVYTFRAHGMADPGGTQSVEVPVDLDVALLQGSEEPIGPSLSVDVVEQIKGRLKLEVGGAGYATGQPGVYVGLSESGGASATDASVYRGTQWVKPTDMSADGSFSVTLELDAAAIATLDPAKSYSVYSLKAHGQAAADPSQSVEKPVTLDIGLLQGGGTDPVDPGDGGNGTDRPETKTKGSLRWGIKDAFRSYVTGPIANGSISVSGGASASGGSYRFYQKSTSATASGTGVTRYGGAVTFSGHGGVLNLRIADPVITVQSASRGTLSAVMGGSRITLATLNLSRASKTTKAGAVTFSGAPATLTTQGAGPSGFQGYYTAGESLDPVTFTIGADGGAASGSRTVASAATKAEFTPPATPPATTGLSSDELESEAGVRAGDLVEATGEGFGPNETGIAVVVYSTPIVLSQSVTADSEGRATWSGPLPGSLEPGEHTLTFQGSVSRGMTFTVSEDEAAIGRCAVDDATLDWGVKESWRAYVSGSIADGDWTTTGDASYKTPTFTFSKGSGDFDAKASSGDIAFDGALDFAGHHGALKVVLADPVVRILDEDSALLILDVTAGDRAAAETGDASTTTTKAVPFAEIDLSKATVSADGATLTIDDAPATLTEQGHQVFSTYDTGAALDPIDLTIVTADDCATAPTVASDDDSASVAPVDDDGMPVAWWIGGALALLLVFGGGVWLGRRRSTE